MQCDPLFMPSSPAALKSLRPVGPAARWWLRPVAGEVRYDPSWKRWLSYPEDNECDSTRFWRAQVHPEDLAPMLGALNACLEGWRPFYKARFRLRDGAGHYRPMWSRSDGVERDTAGHVLCLQGVLHDLSQGVPTPPEPVRPVVSLEHAQILHTAPVGLLRVEHGLVRWANAAFCELIGVPAAMLVGRPLARLFHEAPPLPSAKAEAQLQRPDGERRWVQLSMASLPGCQDTLVVSCADIGDLRERHTQAEHLALHDALTGLANRRLLGRRLDQALGVAGQEGAMVALVYLDLDNFKHVNDALGHAAGDHLLGQVGARMCAAVRPQDTVARVGGDEFVVLLAGLRQVEEAEAIAQRLIEGVGAEVDLGDGRRVVASVSAGVAFGVPGRTSAAELLTHADRAMFEAKRDRGGCLRVIMAPT